MRGPIPGVIGRVLILVARGVWRFLPILIRAAAATVMLMVTSTIALAIGVPESTDRIARDWQKRATEVVGDSRADVPIYWLLRGTVFLMLLVGWVLSALFTVAVLDFIGLV